jgi:hypothetical protein
MPSVVVLSPNDPEAVHIFWRISGSAGNHFRSAFSTFLSSAWSSTSVSVTFSRTAFARSNAFLQRISSLLSSS